MNRARPFLNKYILQKQLQITDTYHSLNMRFIKPVTTKLMEHTGNVIINNTKRQKMKQAREGQIQRQNKILLDKISTVMTKKGIYSMSKTINFRTKLNKSLNITQRKKQDQLIYQENQRFVSRLEQKKPTLNIEKLNKDWENNKEVIKRISNSNFYLANFRCQQKHNRYGSAKDCLLKSKVELSKINKLYTINGCKMKIRAGFVRGYLKITADCLDGESLKQIEMPKEEAIYFIQEQCNGKIEELIDKLKYDQLTGALYIVSDSLVEVARDDFTQFNPEIATKTKAENQFKPKKRNKFDNSIQKCKKQASYSIIPEQKMSTNNLDSNIRPTTKDQSKPANADINQEYLIPNAQQIELQGFIQSKESLQSSSFLDRIVNRSSLAEDADITITIPEQQSNHIVIEPQQLEDYNQVIDNSQILKRPQSKDRVQGHIINDQSIC